MKRTLKKLATGAVALGSTSVVMAADYTTAISDAATEASGNQSAVVAGVIGVAVISFGVGALIRFLGR
ncbi:hypothetical protein [Ferrimonas pelagia]|uniref:Uncharacterized protein n=1 Tax=Ferrimonas pelagia TaxID=1177826 RepID=A0ABP9F980_9GAMM